MPPGEANEVAAREAAPVSLLERVQDFLVKERASLRSMTKLELLSKNDEAVDNAGMAYLDWQQLRLIVLSIQTALVRD